MRNPIHLNQTKILSSAVTLLVFLLLPASADVLTTVADTYVRSPGSGDTNYGTSTTLAAGNNVQNQKDKNLISFVKFDLSSLTDTISSATFTLDRLTAQDWTFDIYGIPDGVGDEDFNESTLTFNNSNHTTVSTVVTDPYYLNGSMDGTGLDYLGSFSTGNVTGLLNFSNAALVSYLNADGNDIATLVFHANLNTSGAVSSIFASEEHGSGQAPQLTITVIPEPSTLSLILGFAGLAFLTLRKRR